MSYVSITPLLVADIVRQLPTLSAVSHMTSGDLTALHRALALQLGYDPSQEAKSYLERFRLVTARGPLSSFRGTGVWKLTDRCMHPNAVVILRPESETPLSVDLTLETVFEVSGVTPLILGEVQVFSGTATPVEFTTLGNLLALESLVDLTEIQALRRDPSRILTRDEVLTPLTLDEVVMPGELGGDSLQDKYDVTRAMAALLDGVRLFAFRREKGAESITSGPTGYRSLLSFDQIPR